MDRQAQADAIVKTALAACTEAEGAGAEEEARRWAQIVLEAKRITLLAAMDSALAGLDGDAGAA